MTAKKKLVLIPSAYSHKAMGDIENFIPFYKDIFDLYVLTDDDFEPVETVVDGVHYVRSKTMMATYLQVMADYVIDAGALNGSSKLFRNQKRISVWHGTPYKNMFVDLDREHIITAYDYTYGIDLMVSPSQWYTERFLRQSMLYEGEVLETAISRTDSLFLSDEQKDAIRSECGIPKGKKVLLYAPTFRESGTMALPFSARKALSTLGNEWVLVVKLHYLNTLKGVGIDPRVIDATEYQSVNNLLAIADCMITDYSSLLFDYSILGKPALLYQYDRAEYEADRSFMFSLEDYVDISTLAFDEEAFYEKLGHLDSLGDNLQKIRQTFYPHQHEHSTAELVEKLALDPKPREVSEVIFLVNELNQIGGVHSFIMNLAKELKAKYNSKIIVIGTREFDTNKDGAYIFDPENLIDVKLSFENDQRLANSIVKNTDGYIISCQYGGHHTFQKYLKYKKAVLMFHGDTKDVVNRTLYKGHLDGYNKNRVRNYRRFVLLSKGNWEVIRDHLREDISAKSTYIENGMDFSDGKNLYRESGDFAFVSRLDPDKNPLELVEIFASENMNPNYRLHIYGDGSLKADIERRIEEAGLTDRVILHGYVSDKEEIYRDKQGVLLASMSEGLPFTLVESIKFGIPVYVYDSFTSCRDIVTDETGVRVPTGDREAFVAALNDPFPMSKFSSAELADRFSNDAVTKRWKALFDELDEELAAELAEMGVAENANMQQEIKRIRTEEQAAKAKAKPKGEKKPEGGKKPAGRKKPKAAKNPTDGPSVKTRVKKLVRKIPYFHDEIHYAETTTALRNLRNRSKASDQPLVSIIMPFYNNSSTVQTAIRSVAKCGYKNYEIILVNDGSAEDPTNLIRKFDRVVYLYKENGGLSSARNYGLDHAKGKYVLYLDSDDILYPGGLTRLVNYAEKHDLNMVCGITLRRYKAQKRVEVWYPNLYRETHINAMPQRQLIIDDTIATGKLYNLEFLRSIGIRFQDGLYEDVLYTGELFAKVDRIGMVKARTQVWEVYGSNTSITTNLTVDNARARIKNLDTIFAMHNDVMKTYYTRQFIRHHAVASIYGFNRLPEEEKRELYELLRQSMLMKRPFIFDKFIVMPTKKMLYQALLDDDYDRFALLAEGFSTHYYNLHSASEE